MNAPRSPSSTLNDAWTGAFAQGLRSDAILSPQAQARIKQQLIAKIAASAGTAQTAQPPTPQLTRDLRRDEGWKPLGKRAQVKVLHDDGTTFSWLLKLLPGGRLPVHDHADGAEECVVMEGQLRLNGVEFQAGDFQIAFPGSVHDEVASDEGCLVYLRSPSSRRKDLMGV
jgi:anti-sigma factor ChrR (cupin superfamily)